MSSEQWAVGTGDCLHIALLRVRKKQAVPTGTSPDLQTPSLRGKWAGGSGFLPIAASGSVAHRSLFTGSRIREVAIP